MCVVNVVTAKTSLLVCVWILILCVENVYCNFVSSLNIYSLRLLPHRDWSYHDYLDPVSLTLLYAITLTPYSTLYNKHTELGGAAVSASERPHHPTSAFLYYVSDLSLFPHDFNQGFGLSPLKIMS